MRPEKIKADLITYKDSLRSGAALWAAWRPAGAPLLSSSCLVAPINGRLYIFDFFYKIVSPKKNSTYSNAPKHPQTPQTPRKRPDFFFRSIILLTA